MGCGVVVLGWIGHIEDQVESKMTEVDALRDDDSGCDITLGPEMSDAETAAWIRTWCAAPRGLYSWPTDPCGYEQHIKFVQRWNAHQRQGDLRAFALAYAEELDPVGSGTQASSAERSVTSRRSEAPESSSQNVNSLSPQTKAD
jgi:hypothetical protein